MADATLGTAVLRTKLDRSGLKSGLDGARSDTQKFATDSGAAIRGIGAAFGAIAASAGVRSYVSFLRSSANLSQQADAANRLFEKSLGRTNQSLAEGAGLVDRLSTRFGVANSVIESSATLLLRQGASLDDIERALTAAGASAAAAGFDISTAFDNVATAVATGRSELLETSGIVTNLGPVTQQYAKSIGKTVDELTQQEIIQARVNAIYKETASEIEDVDEILQGLPLAQAEVTKQWRTFREDVGGIAAEVITPLTEGLGKVLGYVNDLPEPVKRAGIAMTGAALGATALATGVTAIRTALTGFQALGLLSFGPAGWIVLGVTAVAGLVAVLAGRDNSLESALGKANDALASGDADSLTGALGSVIDKVDGPVKQSLLDLQGELQRTGEVGAEMATKIAEALNQATISQAQTMVDMAAAELETLRNMTLVSTNQATPGELEGPLRDRISRFGRTDLAESLFFDQTNNRFTLPPDSRVGQGKFDFEIVEAIQLANSQLVGISNDHAAAVEAAEKRLADAWTRLTALTNPATPGGGTPTPTPASAGDVPTGAPSDPVTVQLAGGIAGVADFAPTGGGDRLSAAERQARIDTNLSQLAVNAANAADAIAIYADTQRAIGDAEAIQASRTADAWLDLQRAANAGVSTAESGRRGLTSTASVSGATPVALTPPEVQAVVPAAVSLVGALDGLTAGIGDITEGNVKQLRGRISALSELADSAGPEARAALLTLVHNLDVELAELIRRTTPVALGITPTVSIRPISVGQEAFNAGYQGFRNRDLDRGDGGLAEARRINQEREASADRFANTVVDAGFAMGDATIKAIADGDIPGLLRAGLSGAGSILGGANLGSIGFLGGSIGIGALISGGLGIIGSIIGALTQGNRSDAESVRAAGAATRGAPAVELNLNINQSLNIASLTDPASRGAINGLLDNTVRRIEDVITRNIVPRLNALEGAA